MSIIKKDWKSVIIFFAILAVFLVACSDGENMYYLRQPIMIVPIENGDIPVKNSGSESDDNSLQDGDSK